MGVGGSSTFSSSPLTEGVSGGSGDSGGGGVEYRVVVVMEVVVAGVGVVALVLVVVRWCVVVIDDINIDYFRLLTGIWGNERNRRF